jgi:peptidoglycan/LPS O-acetylase OafA/YrhL
MVKEKKFTVLDTLFCKGMAISMVLIHHLFYQTLDYGRATYQIALMSKVSVAIFVFLSGFGLYKSYGKKGGAGIGGYYLVRLKCLYFPYWLIWLTFVPAGIIYFDRSLAAVYGSDIIIKLIQNILGLHMVFSFWGYNATWWFISLILGLYILSPLVFYLVNRLKLLSVIFAIVFLIIPDSFRLYFLTIYIFPFVLGAYVSRENIMEKTAYLMSNRMGLKLLAYLSMLTFLFWQRQYGMFKGADPAHPSSIDGILALLIIMICFEYLGKIGILRSAMVFTGRHAYNIFLFHTFIYYYYFEKFIYSFSYVPLIFCVLLGISLLISMALEWILRISGINKPAASHQPAC